MHRKQKEGNCKGANPYLETSLNSLWVNANRSLSCNRKYFGKQGDTDGQVLIFLLLTGPQMCFCLPKVEISPGQGHSLFVPPTSTKAKYPAQRLSDGAVVVDSNPSEISGICYHLAAKVRHSSKRSLPNTWGKKQVSPRTFSPIHLNEKEKLTLPKQTIFKRHLSIQ